jgi:hypothetical protein
VIEPLFVWHVSWIVNMLWACFAFGFIFLGFIEHNEHNNLQAVASWFLALMFGLMAIGIIVWEW